MKIFIDTSVIIASSLSDHINFPAARKIVSSVHSKKAAGYVAAHSLIEAYSVLTRLPQPNRLSSKSAFMLLEHNIKKHFSVISLVSREYLEFLADASEKGWGGGLIYDALIMRCADKSSANTTYTFNVKHFTEVAGAYRGLIKSP